MALHIVHFYGPINSDSASTVRNLCLMAMKAGAKEIDLRISTEGGNMTAGFALFDFLMSLPLPLTTHNVGSVDSVGVPIFLAGKKRYASPKTRFLVHPLHWGFGDIVSADHARIAEWRDCLNFDAERYIQVFTEATACAPEPVDIRPFLKGDARIFRPREAVQAGIIHAERQAQTLPWSEATHWWET